MSAEEELKQWLARPEKSFTENLRFGIKVCKSLEFAFQNKYEIVFDWFIANFHCIDELPVDKELLSEIVRIEFPQHLVAVTTKQRFVNILENYVTGLPVNAFDPKAIDLLFVLSQNQSYQIFYRSHAPIYCCLQSTLFRSYAKCAAKAEFVASAQTEFYGKAIKALREFIEHSGKGFRTAFGKHLLDVLMESSIYMLNEKIFYNDIKEILKLIYFDKSGYDFLLENIGKISLPSALHGLDFVVNYCRCDSAALQTVVRFVVNSQDSPEIRLYQAIQVFDLFRKYNVNGDFNVAIGEDESEKPAVQILAKYVEECVENVAGHLKLILKLVTSAIRWNPISLEKAMFRLTVRFILTTKTDNDWPDFVEFLILIIDVFKKLGRSEKLVQYLVKSLKGQLQIQGLSNSLKRKSHGDDTDRTRKRIKLENNADETIEESSPIDTKLLNIVRAEFDSAKSSSSLPRSQKWKYISMAWPHESVGHHFTEFVTSLLAKPSMVLWKTLIFSVGDALKELQSSTSEKSLVVLDFSSVLLCEYLAGSRLPEQTDKFWTEIQATRRIMQNVLQDFGQALLANEHNNRTIDAFLEICYHVGYFDLITAFYAPETVTIPPPDLHNYLGKEQWVSLEQRIVNFGSTGAKTCMNQLHLQKMRSKLLFSSNSNAKPKTLDVHRYLLNQTLTDSRLLKPICEDPLNFWLTNQLKREEKIEICNLLITDDFHIELNALTILMEDREFFELFTIRLYDLMVGCFDSSKKSILKMVGTETKTKKIVATIKEKLEKYSIKHYDDDRLQEILRIIIEMIPIGCCSTETMKPKIFALTLALYRDVLATKNERLAAMCFTVLSKLLNFGDSFDIFAYFDLSTFMQIFSPIKFPEFYRLLFDSANIWNQSTEATFAKLYADFADRKFKLADDEIALVVLIVQFQPQCPVKSIKHHLGNFLRLIIENIENYFNNISSGAADEDKEFVRKTAPLMPLYLNQSQVKGKEVIDFSTNFQEIYKKYVGYSQNSEIYTKLIGGAIQYRKQLGFDVEEVDLIIQEMLKTLLNDAKNGTLDEMNGEKILKNITSHQTTEQFIRMFSHMEETLDNRQICRMLLVLTKCSLSTYNGTVLNSCCHIMLFNMILSLQKTSSRTFEDADLVASILRLMEAICHNKKNPISVRFVDDILAFLMDIHIRQYAVDAEGQDGHRRTFQVIHRGIIRVCAELIHCQSSIVLDRIPQFVYVYKELLCALLTYRSNRLKVADLEMGEIAEIASLAHDLENLMHAMAKFPTEIKRIAAYLLTYCINSMIVNSRYTVRYPKIKLHVENICYELIALCDHRVGSFILRSSNDATKQTYEKLCKEYTKYRKFKGKV